MSTYVCACICLHACACCEFEKLLRVGHTLELCNLDLLKLMAMFGTISKVKQYNEQIVQDMTFICMPPCPCGKGIQHWNNDLRK